MPFFLILVQWLVVLQQLKEAPAEDQFGKEVTWSSFASKPFVLVIGDRGSSELATAVGSTLQSTYNRHHIKPELHLHSTTPDEKLKVIAVAALPDVPGIFKGLFRSGFKDEGKTGVILDWDRSLARSCGYREGTVLLVLKSQRSDQLRIREVTTGDQAVSFITSELAK